MFNFFIMSKRSRYGDAADVVSSSAAATSSSAGGAAAVGFSVAEASPGVLATSDTAASGSFGAADLPWCVLCIIIDFVFVGHISAWIRTSKTMCRRLRPGDGESLMTALYMRSNLYSCWDGTLRDRGEHNEHNGRHSVVNCFADSGECNYWLSVPHEDMNDELAHKYDQMFYKIAALEHARHAQTSVHYLQHLREFHFSELTSTFTELNDPGDWLWVSGRGGESSSRLYLNKLVHLLATQCPQLAYLSLLNIPAWTYEPAEEEGEKDSFFLVSTMDDRAMCYLGEHAHNLKHLMISVRNLPPPPSWIDFDEHEYEMAKSERRIGITPRGVEWLGNLALETLVLDTAAWGLEGFEGTQWEPYNFDTLLATVHENFGGTLTRLRLPLERSVKVGFETKQPVVFEHVTHIGTGIKLPNASNLAKMFPNLTHLDMNYIFASRDEREFHAVLDILTHYPNLKRLSICNDARRRIRNPIHLIGKLCPELTHVRIGHSNRRHIAALVKLCPNLIDINADVAPTKHGRRGQVFESRAEMEEWALGMDTSKLGV